MRQLTFVLCVLVASAAFGQAKAVVTGPKESLSGDLVILDASQSQAQKYLWKLLESDKSFLSTDGGLKCIFAAGVDEPRTFHFILVVAGTNANGGPEVDIATHDIVVKPRNYKPPTNPTPENPTVPAPDRRPTRVTYLYEKDQNPVPSKVLKGLIDLNSAGVSASYFEIDGTDSGTETPEQYKVAVSAGKDKIPCLVVEYADKSTKVVNSPKNEQEVVDSVKN